MNGWTFLKPGTISWRVLTGASLLLLAAAGFAWPSARAATCESLATLALPETTITVAKAEPAGRFTPTQLHLPGPPLENLPAFCRIAGEIKPTKDSTSSLNCGCLHPAGTVSSWAPGMAAGPEKSGIRN